EEIILVQKAEHEVGIADGRLRAAKAIAHGTGFCARALRSDLEQPGVAIDPGNAAAARADRFHPDLGRENIMAQNHRTVVSLDLAVTHDAYLERGAAHIGD